jgi:hypothetical protein
MTRLTLTLEGSIEELTPILQKLSHVDAPTTGLNLQPQSKEPQTPATLPDWTADKAHMTCRWVTYDCMKILREIAKKPEGCSLEDIQKILSLSPNQIGGRLSSVGHQIRMRGYQNLSHPLNPTGIGYRLHPAWREAVLEWELMVQRDMEQPKSAIEGEEPSQEE